MHTHVTGLESFGLNAISFRRLGNRKVMAYVYLQTYDVTPAVQRLPRSRRQLYMAARVDRWIKKLYRLHPKLSFQVKGGAKPTSGMRRWSQLPTTLVVRIIPREVLALANAAGVRSIHVTKVARRRRAKSPKPLLEWYCVRASVVIRVEREKSGLQNTEDRFMLVRATSCEDAERRLKQQWVEYARPYLNSEGQMVSWQLDKVVDVYSTCETEIDPAGFEVYSKLGKRRMRPKYVWRPKSFAKSR
jgi:Domain of unknown function (DUF4288)